MSLHAARDAIALALINRDCRMCDCPEVASLEDVRLPADVDAYRGMATAALLCLTARGWVPPPGGG